MLIAALRDLQWRRRRFMIAVVGTAMVFAMTLVLTGLANGFRVEAERSVDALGLDHFMIKEGAAGPFLGSAPLPPNAVQIAARLPGVDTAVPLVYGSSTIPADGTPRNVNVFGVPDDGPGAPHLKEGRAPHAVDEVAVSTTMGRPIGADIDVGAAKLHVVGLVDDSTALAGQDNIYLTVPGAQQLLFSGQKLISSVGILGTPQQTPPDFRIVDRAGAVDDMVRALRGAKQAMSLMAGLLWAVAALIVGSVIYLSALERSRDFAVFKAVGVATRSIMAGLAMQAVTVALLAALLGAGLSLVLGPPFPMRCDVPTAAFVALPILAVGIGLLASVAGLRRAVTIDPALAFRGP
ncbi:glutamine ABC transporter permease [Mycobacterium sp. NS-7484]|uniref:ABC transporter permease n=1 Tax=unclassified Mycobacterium TaxID=2642494 RepID=UPI0008012A67|nr:MULTISPECIES: ABC transporter permease [unclassified Mycobacterium]OBG82634.1 glutamine ABC transporter permease [Mycobacterium sp. E802]OMC01049.1 glutamine ABC transporter permease [Mycobacterium sp. NS-7484]